MGKEIKFRPATFYLGIADMLAREVEGHDRDQIDLDPHEDREIEELKVGPGIELEEHATVTPSCVSEPDLIPPLVSKKKT